MRIAGFLTRLNMITVKLERSYYYGRKDCELTLKELALFLPRLPSGPRILFLAHSATSEGYKDIGDLPLKVFVDQYSKAALLKHKGAGPKTIEILSAGLKAAGLEWK